MFKRLGEDIKTKARKIFHSRPSAPVNPPSNPEDSTSLPAAKAHPAASIQDTAAVAPGVPPSGDSPSSPTKTPSISPDSAPLTATTRPVVVLSTTTEAPSASGAVPVPRVVVALEKETPVAEVKLTNLKDSIVDNLAIALDVTARLAALAHSVPFLGPVAGSLSQILKVYKEVQDTKGKHGKLLACINGISQDICATVLRMEETGHVDLLGRLKPDLETYASLLQKASKFVADYDSLGLIHRGAARNQLGGSISDLQQELDSFGSRFRSSRLVDLSLQQNTMKATLDKVHDMVVEARLEKWLHSPPDMAQKQNEMYRHRHDDTVLWFLEGETFIHWQDNAGVLWIVGASGTGKSTLSSTVINMLIYDPLSEDLGRSSAIGFFFFDFKSNDSYPVETALRRLVLQLSAQSPHPYSTLDKQYSLSNGQTLPTYKALLAVFKTLLTELRRVYIVLDALDECQEDAYPQLVDLVLTMQTWTTTNQLHLLFTSQLRVAFSAGFRDVACVSLKSDVIDGDIRRFISTELHNKPGLKIWAPRANEIIGRLTLKSSGMFRLAACLLVELSYCKRQTELDETLQNLPTDLFGIYDRFMSKIREKDLIYVTGVLRWLMFSKESITLTQMANTVAFDFSDPSHFTYDPSLSDDNTNAIPGWLVGLATLRDDGYIVLEHASVQDYLLSPKFTQRFCHDLSDGHSHMFIARSCLGHLLYFNNHPIDAETVDKYPLASYAEQYWCDHLLQSNDQPALYSQAMDLLQDGSTQYTALDFLCSHREYRWSSGGTVEQKPPLCLCAEAGYIEGAGALLKNGAEVNVKWQDSGSMLTVASCANHLEIVSLLLEHGANINAEGGEYGNALQAASWRGSTEVVSLLLKHGANIDAEGGEYGNALQAASWRGSTEVVSLLLKHGANINVQGGKYGSVLQAASCQGHTEVVSLLLEHGANINAQGGEYGNALQAASCWGRTEVVSLLLEHGVDINAQGGEYGNALQAASCQGHADVMSLLLKQGANINAQGGKYGNALQAASCQGHADVVSLLLKQGANINAQGGKYGNSLQAASWRGMSEVVHILLKHSANINVQGGQYGNALQAASWRGSTEVVSLLLTHGADINAQGGEYGNALQAASCEGETEVVSLLLKHGANINVQGGEYGNALQAASCQGHTEVVSLLLEHGANINAQGGEYGNALQAASCWGHADVVSLLLKQGANINAQGGKYGNTLQAASWRGSTDVVSLLLEHGANINAQGGKYGNALQAASCEGEKEVVSLLLEHGADINAQGGEYGSALAAASMEDKIEIVQLLLASGVDVKVQGGLGQALHYASPEICSLLKENGAEDSDVEVDCDYPKSE